MSWSARYIGIPWTREDQGTTGTHCWGLVRLVYAGVFGIALPDCGPSIGSVPDSERIAAGRIAWPWRIVDTPLAGDVVLFRQGHYEDHVGVLVDRRLMLHVERDRTSEVIEIAAPRWRHRLVAIHRHAEMETRHGG